MAVNGLYHAGLTVRNLERSIGFYRDLLGLELVRRQESDAPYIGQLTGLPGTRLHVAYLRPPASNGPFLELVEYRAPAGTPVDTTPCNPGTGHVCFFVDDLDSRYTALQAQGVTFTSAPVSITAGFHAGCKAVYLKDPDNIIIELFQR